MNTNNINAVICVFCENIIADQIDYVNTQFCVDCNEYKGLMTLGDFMAVYA
jgi:hypothetical protein